MSSFVTVVEMGPRDGLQNEARIIPTADKIRLVNLLTDCGFSRIEVTSFVSPKWVPQMADAREVMQGVRRKNDVIYSALTPNIRGYEAAIASGASEVAVFGSASEGFSQKNINCSIKESFERFRPIIEAAMSDKVKVRGYVSCVTDCPYDGEIAPDAVRETALWMQDMGCYEISLGDTIGAATPDKVDRLLSLLLNDLSPAVLAGHFHDTHNMALDNIRKSLEYGLRVFDAAVGGLGGCPYAEGAKGNVDTVRVARMLAEVGYETGLDLQKLEDAARFAVSLRDN